MYHIKNTLIKKVKIGFHYFYVWEIENPYRKLWLDSSLSESIFVVSNWKVYLCLSLDLSWVYSNSKMSLTQISLKWV